MMMFMADATDLKGQIKRVKLKGSETFINSKLLQDIRFALNTGLILGTERFKSEVEELTGGCATPARRESKI